MRCELGLFHPQVPKTFVNVALVYCHQCMAWERWRSLHTQLDDAEPYAREVSSLHFGPFDSLYEVVHDANDSIAALMLAPGRPWDTGPLPAAAF